jgi:hypothetical protein
MDLFCTIVNGVCVYWLYSMDLFCTIVNGVCVYYTRMEVFHTIVNGSTHCVLFSCISIYNLNHTVPFSQPKKSKFVLCATGCTPRMDLFRTIETFFVPESDSILHFIFLGHKRPNRV